MRRERGRGTTHCNGSAGREGLYLRPKEQGQINCGETVIAVQRSRELLEKHFGKKTVSAQAVAFAESNRAIPDRGEGTGADHGPSSPVPQSARNAFRLCFAPGH